MAGSFLKQAAQDLARIRAALASGQAEGLRRMAHAMKGLLAGLKAAPAWREAERLERAAHGLPAAASAAWAPD